MNGFFFCQIFLMIRFIWSIKSECIIFFTNLTDLIQFTDSLPVVAVNSSMDGNIIEINGVIWPKEAKFKY